MEENTNVTTAPATEERAAAPKEGPKFVKRIPRKMVSVPLCPLFPP